LFYWRLPEQHVVGSSARIKMTDVHLTQIRKDLPRTFPELSLIQERQALIEAILTDYAAFDSELGYCQGMSCLAAVIAERINDSEEASTHFRHIVGPLRGIWLPGFPLVVTGMSAFDTVLKKSNCALHTHLTKHDLSYDMFLPDVWLTQFSRWLPFSFLWDVFEYVEAHGFPGVLAITAALMSLSTPSLLEEADFSALFVALKSLADKAKHLELSKVLDASKEVLPVVQEVLQQELTNSKAISRCSIVRDSSRVLYAGTDLEVICQSNSETYIEQVAQTLRLWYARGSHQNGTPTSNSTKSTLRISERVCWPFGNWDSRCSMYTDALKMSRCSR